MDLIFSAGTLEKCLEKASLELKIDIVDLEYKIIREERKLFKKFVEIEILNNNRKTNEESTEKITESLSQNEIKKENDNQIDENVIQVEEEKETINVLNTGKAGAKVEKGKIIIKESENENKVITIKACEGIDLFLNKKETDFITDAKESDIIEYSFKSEEAKRNFEISVSNDKMEAYITIESIPEYVYELADQEYTYNLILEKHKVKENYLPDCSKEEIISALKERGIVSGIIDDAVEECSTQRNIDNLCIAKGQPIINDTPNEVKILFKDLDELEEVADTEKRIDYRNRYMIATATNGDVIGQLIPGKEGKDGINVLGTIIKKKSINNVSLKAGHGCVIEDDKVIATIDGKPSVKGSIFNVNKLYSVDEVNLKTGNVNFVGDIEISGTVEDGMEVVAGNSLYIGKNIESAKVGAEDKITINGNVLNSTVISGYRNSEKRQYLSDLKELTEIIEILIDSLNQIEENNLLGNRKIGQVIKLLIEKKFKSLDYTIKSMLNYYDIENIDDSRIKLFVVNNLVGLGTLNIKSSNELKDFRELLIEEIEEIDSMINIPSDIYIEYTQGSTIQASGNVIITGKGQYTSNITAVNSIEFTKENAVCRGGILNAGSEIRLRTVGSMAGIGTTLKVPKDGRITAEIAYNNTLFCFGDKQRLLEVPSKDVEAYLDRNGDIVIDKLLL